MKTTEQAAKSYASRTAGCRYDLAFIAGVKWAQEWTSILDEMPPAAKVLTLDKENEVSLLDWRGKSAQEIKESVHYFEIEYWRPITKL